MSTQQDIKDRIASFAIELEELVRRAAIAAVSDALGQGAPRAVAKRPAPARVPAPPSSQPTVSARRKKGGKRDPKEIDALTERVASWVKANAGRRVEEIGKALSTPTKELALPIIRLLGNKTIKKSGQKRATKYFPR